MKHYRLAAPVTAAIGLAVLALLTGVFEAGTSLMLRDGHLLTVAIENDPYNPSVQGLVLLDETASGTSSQTIISTWDPFIDQGPNLSLDPYDGQPVVIWSRQVGGADFELAMMRRLPGGYWAPFDILTNNQTNDIEPRAIIDINDMAHIVWWPSGIGGPVFLHSFDVPTGHGNGQPQRPFEGGGNGRKIGLTTCPDCLGGGEDPGTIAGVSTRASADPCLANPAAAPDHGVVLGCGRPAAYQLSNCKLLVGVYDTTTSAWTLTVADLSRALLGSTSVREIVQMQVDARCH
jgi:hypothetical protein